jgi:hypothetical protein
MIRVVRTPFTDALLSFKRTKFYVRFSQRKNWQL